MAAGQTREEFLREKLANFAKFIERLLPYAVKDKSLLHELSTADRETITFFVRSTLSPNLARYQSCDLSSIAELCKIAGIQLDPEDISREDRVLFFRYMECFIEFCA